jgi:hypothetical protein
MEKAMEGRIALAIVATLILSVSAFAQNTTSRALMAASEDRRHAAFKMILDSTGDRCDVIVRTQYNASVGDSDDWEAKCRDGGHYSFSIYGDLNKQTRVLSCRELAAADSFFQKRARTNNPPTGCRMR